MPSSSPSSTLKRRRIDSPGEKQLLESIFPPAGPSREAKLAWDDDFPEQFDILEKIGEGSFGTVWTAREHGNAASPLFALKRINPTCSPSRILNEYQQMRKLGGQNNVVEAHGLVRTNGGAFAMVMPYFEHGEFKDYMKTLTLSGIAAYMRSLLTALTHVHDQGVIHRDIKPRNFMYSVERQQGLLIDFGLAEPAQKWKGRAEALAKHRDKKARGKVQHTSPESRRYNEVSVNTVGGRIENRGEPSCTEGVGNVPSNIDGGGGGTATGACGEKDNRLRLLRKVERGGTTGFRAPEVLWHSRDQEPVVDVWSAGVILLCLLSRRYPLFPSADNDEIALVHIAALCGFDQVRRAARESGRCDVTEFPEVIKRGSVEALCAPLLGGLALDPEEERMRDNAMSLIGEMLIVDPRQRVSARHALEHPFVADS